VVRIKAIILMTVIIMACTEENRVTKENGEELPNITIVLDLKEANRLADLPLHCITNPLPYKSGHTIETDADLDMPQNHHPAFYGCFDWHSAVHGHWSLVYLIKEFPDLAKQTEARAKLHQNLTTGNIQKEVDYFTMNNYTKSFERTYGWAWIFKLQEELDTWDDNDAKEWARSLQPLTDHLVQAYIDYLPKLVYPIRVGEHSNSAFGLSFAYDYAKSANLEELKEMIERSALRFYQNDKGCPIHWEPSGYDFLSPCLQEIDIMRKVLNNESFDRWLADFLPELSNGTLDLEPGKIRDRSDGKLVHLDGLNFSRAWCLYQLDNNVNAQNTADEHLAYSLEKITDGDYAGQHWLASFALYAFKCKMQ